MQGDPEARHGLIDRIDMFLSDRRIETMLCDIPKISWRDVVENHRTVILDCQRMSGDKMIFMGNIVSHGLKNYLRFERNVSKYKPVALFIDECQLFVNQDMYIILKEARKYNITAILATQDFSNLEPKLVGTMMSNMGTIVGYRMGYNEAKFMSRECKAVSIPAMQFPGEHYCTYRTPSAQGVAKCLPPPYIRKKTIGSPKLVTGPDFFPKWIDAVEIEPSHHNEGANVSAKA